MLLALIVWIGGLVFFGFVLAPTAFTVLPTPALAGDVVGHSLNALHWMGIVSALVFLASSLLYNLARFRQMKLFMLVNALVLVMLILTLASQLALSPRIHALRARLQPGGAVQDQAQTEFNRLHMWSTSLETGILALGLGAVVLTARRLT